MSIPLTAAQSPAAKIARDSLAQAIMLKALDRDWSLWRDPKFLAAQSYLITDAMIAAGEKQGR